ncbi:Cystathionine gamma-synthase [Thermobaculum terrenum ATCC BAA-798]|uniref:homocysteine desulfhydrase n=1 Tax=Thermobaculum terrenum (strain ATCC BAA-798 / CCMEE 7001 / YNP1) TaxID=525904 RepID=D1CBF5_THET1|nr:PLP-dependent aspartate aminotransferase family protein [Thermobaculum terrenum]ACZ42120.1 Cystathionine gamma-synthase [Thermobaculum terrenum ATCC BAA-798]
MVSRPDGKPLGFNTQLVHSSTCSSRVGEVKPVVPPIYSSVTYVSEDPADLKSILLGEKEGYVYSRNGNPTVSELRKAIADIEAATDAVVFASGMAAIHASLIALGVSPGTKIVASKDLYGVTVSLLNEVIRPLGVEVIYTDLTDLENAERVITSQKPLVVFCETVSNPLLRIVDIRAIADIAHAVRSFLVVDNTFCTPLMARPLEMGADISLNSTTKYISGHGDVVGGCAAGAWDVCGRMQSVAIYSGGVMGPFEAWLTLRGMRTLGLRFAKQCENAQAISRLLKDHPAVSAVNYPGLESHPQHDLASDMFHGTYGAMLSFSLKDDTVEAAYRFMRALKICLPATSLGDVFTLVLHPATSSHLTMNEDSRRAAGITPGLVRISAGIEDTDDILTDIANALDAI